MHVLKYRRIAEYIYSCLIFFKHFGEKSISPPPNSHEARGREHSLSLTHTDAMSALVIGGDRGAGSSAAHEPRAPPPPLLDDHGHCRL